MSKADKNKKIAKNTLMLYFRMILTMLVSLYTSRVVLNNLGVEDYGTYNVVGGIVTMFGFINGAMSSATQRFLSFDLGKNNFIQLRKTFNATRAIHLGISLFIFVLAETIGLWFVQTQLRLPEGRMDAAIWIYHFAVLSFMISIYQVPYNALIFAREKMNIYAYLSILEVTLKLLIVFLLNWIEYDKLILYGILTFSVSLFMIAFYRIYCWKHYDETRFELVKDKSLYKTLISYSGWNLFGNIAVVAKGQGVSIILNIFFGTVVNAAQAISNQVSGAVSQFVFNFQIASNPQIIKSYASKDKEYMNQLMISTSKFSFYLLYILTLPIMLEAHYIITFWLKMVPAYTVPFTILILINILIDTVSGPLMIGIQATGKIKLYQTVVGLLQILILPLSYLCFCFGEPPESTFLVNIFISIIALIFRLKLIKKQMQEFAIRQFVHDVVLRSAPVIFISICIPLWLKMSLPEGILRCSLILMSSFSFSVATIYFLGINKNEKAFIKTYLNSLLNKLSHIKR